MKDLYNRIKELYDTINKQKPPEGEEIYLRILTGEEKDERDKWWNLDDEPLEEDQ